MAFCLVEQGGSRRRSDFFLAELVQVAPNKLGAAHLVTKIVTGNEQTDTQTGKNYKCHSVSPLILFYYQLIDEIALFLNSFQLTSMDQNNGAQVSFRTLSL